MSRLTRQVDLARPGCKPIDFCFFVFGFLLKRRCFDLKKTDSADLMTRLKPETGPGLKTMILKSYGILVTFYTYFSGLEFRLNNNIIYILFFHRTYILPTIKFILFFWLEMSRDLGLMVYIFLRFQMGLD